MVNKEWFASWFDSPYYPVLYQHRDYQEAEAFIQQLVARIDPPQGSNVLDLACGRGRHSIFLNRMGLRVTGVDLSPESIADANLHANDTLDFHVRDMRNPFDLGSFFLILNLFTSFGYFQDPADNLQVLRNIKASLQPGGIFLLDFLSAPYIISNLVPKEKKSLQGIEFNLRRTVSNGKIIKEIEILDGEQQYEFSEQVQAFSKAELESMVEKAGMEVFEVWGNYKGAPWSETESTRLILFCKSAE